MMQRNTNIPGGRDIIAEVGGTTTTERLLNDLFVEMKTIVDGIVANGKKYPSRGSSAPDSIPYSEGSDDGGGKSSERDAVSSLDGWIHSSLREKLLLSRLSRRIERAVESLSQQRQEKKQKNEINEVANNKRNKKTDDSDGHDSSDTTREEEVLAADLRKLITVVVSGSSGWLPPHLRQQLQQLQFEHQHQQQQVIPVGPTEEFITGTAKLLLTELTKRAPLRADSASSSPTPTLQEGLSTLLHIAFFQPTLSVQSKQEEGEEEQGGTHALHHRGHHHLLCCSLFSELILLEYSRCVTAVLEGIHCLRSRGDHIDGGHLVDDAAEVVMYRHWEYSILEWHYDTTRKVMMQMMRMCHGGRTLGSNLNFFNNNHNHRIRIKQHFYGNCLYLLHDPIINNVSRLSAYNYYTYSSGGSAAAGGVMDNSSSVVGVQFSSSSASSSSSSFGITHRLAQAALDLSRYYTTAATVTTATATATTVHPSNSGSNSIGFGGGSISDSSGSSSSGDFFVVSRRVRAMELRRLASRYAADNVVCRAVGLALYVSTFVTIVCDLVTEVVGDIEDETAALLLAASELDNADDGGVNSSGDGNDGTTTDEDEEEEKEATNGEERKGLMRKRRRRRRKNYFDTSSDFNFNTTTGTGTSGGGGCGGGGNGVVSMDRGDERLVTGLYADYYAYTARQERKKNKEKEKKHGDIENSRTGGDHGNNEKATTDQWSRFGFGFGGEGAADNSNLIYDQFRNEIKKMIRFQLQASQRSPVNGRSASAADSSRNNVKGCNKDGGSSSSSSSPSRSLFSTLNVTDLLKALVQLVSDTCETGDGDGNDFRFLISNNGGNGGGGTGGGDGDGPVQVQSGIDGRNKSNNDGNSSVRKSNIVTIVEELLSLLKATAGHNDGGGGHARHPSSNDDDVNYDDADDDHHHASMYHDAVSLDSSTSTTGHGEDDAQEEGDQFSPCVLLRNYVAMCQCELLRSGTTSTTATTTTSTSSTPSLTLLNTANALSIVTFDGRSCDGGGGGGDGKSEKDERGGGTETSSGLGRALGLGLLPPSYHPRDGVDHIDDRCRDNDRRDRSSDDISLLHLVEVTPTTTVSSEEGEQRKPITDDVDSRSCRHHCEEVIENSLLSSIHNDVVRDTHSWLLATLISSSSSSVNNSTGQGEGSQQWQKKQERRNLTKCHKMCQVLDSLLLPPPSSNPSSSVGGDGADAEQRRAETTRNAQQPQAIEMLSEVLQIKRKHFLPKTPPTEAGGGNGGGGRPRRRRPGEGGERERSQRPAAEYGEREEEKEKDDAVIQNSQAASSVSSSGSSSSSSNIKALLLAARLTPFVVDLLLINGKQQQRRKQQQQQIDAVTNASEALFGQNQEKVTEEKGERVYQDGPDKKKNKLKNKQDVAQSSATSATATATMPSSSSLSPWRYGTDGSKGLVLMAPPEDQNQQLQQHQPYPIVPPPPAPQQLPFPPLSASHQYIYDLHHHDSQHKQRPLPQQSHQYQQRQRVSRGGSVLGNGGSNSPCRMTDWNPPPSASAPPPVAATGRVGCAGGIGEGVVGVDDGQDRSSSSSSSEKNTGTPVQLNGQWTRSGRDNPYLMYHQGENKKKKTPPVAETMKQKSKMKTAGNPATVKSTSSRSTEEENITQGEEGKKAKAADGGAQEPESEQEKKKMHQKTTRKKIGEERGKKEIHSNLHHTHPDPSLPSVLQKNKNGIMITGHQGKTQERGRGGGGGIRGESAAVARGPRQKGGGGGGSVVVGGGGKLVVPQLPEAWSSSDRAATSATVLRAMYMGATPPHTPTSFPIPQYAQTARHHYQQQQPQNQQPVVLPALSHTHMPNSTSTVGKKTQQQHFFFHNQHRPHAVPPPLRKKALKTKEHVSSTLRSVTSSFPFGISEPNAAPAAAGVDQRHMFYVNQNQQQDHLYAAAVKVAKRSPSSSVARQRHALSLSSSSVVDSGQGRIIITGKGETEGGHGGGGNVEERKEEERDYNGRREEDTFMRLNNSGWDGTSTQCPDPEMLQYGEGEGGTYYEGGADDDEAAATPLLTKTDHMYRHLLEGVYQNQPLNRVFQLTQQKHHQSNRASNNKLLQQQKYLGEADQVTSISDPASSPPPPSWQRYHHHRGNASDKKGKKSKNSLLSTSAANSDANSTSTASIRKKKQKKISPDEVNGNDLLLQQQEYTLFREQVAVESVLCNEFCIRVKAAIKIQSAWRAAVVRLEAFNRRQVLYFFAYQVQRLSVQRIVDAYRCHIGQQRIAERLQLAYATAQAEADRDRLEMAAAYCITRWARRELRRQAMRVITYGGISSLAALVGGDASGGQLTNDTVAPYLTAVLKIQQWWPWAKAHRAYWEQRNFELQLQKAAEEEALREERAAIAIQAATRGWHCRQVDVPRRRLEVRDLRRRVRECTDMVKFFLTEIKLRHERRQLEIERNSAILARRQSVVVDAMERSYQEALALRRVHAVAQRCVLIKKSAQVIQRAWRCYRARFHHRVFRTMSETCSTARIQAEWFGEQAALKVQRQWRAWVGRQAVRRQKVEWMIAAAASARVIQAVGRRHLCREPFVEALRKRNLLRDQEKMDQSVATTHSAVLTVQSMLRGLTAMRCVARDKAECRHRKEIAFCARVAKLELLAERESMTLWEVEAEGMIRLVQQHKDAIAALQDRVAEDSACRIQRGVRCWIARAALERARAKAALRWKMSAMRADADATTATAVAAEDNIETDENVAITAASNLNVSADGNHMRHMGGKSRYGSNAVLSAAPPTAGVEIKPN